MKTITESQWAAWTPSASDKGDPSPNSQQGLLRMDNLTFDEFGILRIARASKLEAINQFPLSDIYSIFSTTLNGIKTRFVYGDQSTNKAILCTETNPRNFSKTLITASEPAKKCAFLNSLGQVIMCSGTVQRKYDGTNNFTLGIPKPSAPTTSTIATYSVDLSNLDGSSKYTNWSSVNSSTYDDTGTNVNGTAADEPSKIAKTFTIKTVYGSDKDTTNLNGTGKETDDDIFSFNLKVSDVSQLVWFEIIFYCAATPSPQNYFHKFFDFGTLSAAAAELYAPFEIQSDVTTVVQIRRGDFMRVGDTTSKGWDTIKEVRIEVGIVTPPDATANATITFDTLGVKGGTDSTLTGSFNYRVVQVNNTGGYIQLSPASDAASAAASAGNITVVPPGALDSQCNEYWLFRQDENGGLYYFLNKQTGARGFTPANYVDSRLLEDLITDANINPQYNLEYYREALPTTIKGMIWFRDRVVYLTDVGFLPSFKLDPGSYDSRFKYEIVGSNSETTLFIAKLDVGTFIIATTKDFYRISGTFNKIYDPYNPDVSLLDVSITPLGVSDPAISDAFVEYEGNILYVSATGVRLLSNANSLLINDTLEPLFRGEMRYGLSPIKLLADNQSVIAVASQGSRIYWSFPHADGINRVYVLNISAEGRSWRLLTSGDTAHINPYSMCRELDGTILYGGFAGTNNYVRSLESDTQYLSYLPVKFKNKFNYGDNPTVRKDALGLKMKINTGGNIANLQILGLAFDGTVNTTLVQITAQGDAIIDLDIKNQTLNGQKLAVGIPPALAYAYEIASYTNIFTLSWIQLIYEERPLAIMRAIFQASNFGDCGRKRLGTWPFRANLLGQTAICTVRADGATLPTMEFTSGTNDEVDTFLFHGPDGLLAVDWEMEVNITEDDGMEFYEFMQPKFTQVCPPQIHEAIAPANNFDSAARKRIGNFPFQVNLLGQNGTVYCKADGITQTPITLTPMGTDEIQTFNYFPPKDLLAVDWEMKVINDNDMEFYKFLQPTFIEAFPTKVKHAIQPYTNFGKACLKKLSVWPFIANTLGHNISVRVHADGNVIIPANLEVNSSLIDTHFWRNTQDRYAVDWQIEVYGDNEFEFYKFLPPDILQIFPIGRRIDQIGPIDLNASGIVYGARFRILGTAPIHYVVFAGDEFIYEDNITISMNDNTYIEKFPKGIETSICRMVLSSDAVFYRMSVELDVRLTGKESEGKYIMVADASAK